MLSCLVTSLHWYTINSDLHFILLQSLAESAIYSRRESFVDSATSFDSYAHHYAGRYYQCSRWRSSQRIRETELVFDEHPAAILAVRNSHVSPLGI